MEKNQRNFDNMEGNTSMPSAPPSYDEATFKPTYNPQQPPYPQAYPPQGPPVAYANLQQAPPPPMASPNVTYVVPSNPIVAVSLGPQPAVIDCPHCHKSVRTQVTTQAQKSAHIAALILCLIGCYLCCCIPYCMTSFQDVIHHCPQCKSYLGTYKH